jgi:hypothetical protein
VTASWALCTGFCPCQTGNRYGFRSFCNPGRKLFGKVSDVSQTTATLNNSTGSAIKCPSCGLTNFRDAGNCRRCKSDLSAPLDGVTVANQPRVHAADPGRSKFGLAGVLAVMLILLAGAAVFYIKQGAKQAAGALNGTSKTQPASDTSQPQAEAENTVQPGPESEQAAANVLSELKRVQEAAERGVPYAEYDQMVAQLKEDVNVGLAQFAGQSENDKTFRQEAAAAVREFSSARNWWKTTNEHSAVFNDNDRNEKLQFNWSLAKTHIENAEKALGH